MIFSFQFFYNSLILGRILVGMVTKTNNLKNFLTKSNRNGLAQLVLESTSTESVQIISTGPKHGQHKSHRIGGNGKRSKQSTNADQKSLGTVFSIAICCQLGDKLESKTLFLTIFIYVRR